MDENIKLIDCKGLNCPVPIATVAKEIVNLDSGQKMKVIATDPGFELDMKSWIKFTGNKLESFEIKDGQYTAIIVKA